MKIKHCQFVSTRQAIVVFIGIYILLLLLLHHHHHPSATTKYCEIPRRCLWKMRCTVLWSLWLWLWTPSFDPTEIECAICYCTREVKLMWHGSFVIIISSIIQCSMFCRWKMLHISKIKIEEEEKIGPSVTNTFRWGRLSASPGGANKLSKPSLLGLQLEVKAWRAPRLLVVSDNIPACLLSLRAQFHVWWCVLLNDKEVEKPKIIRFSWFLDFPKTSSSLLASPLLLLLIVAPSSICWIISAQGNHGKSPIL